MIASLKRINELAEKARNEGLTEEEIKKERSCGRIIYVKSVDKLTHLWPVSRFLMKMEKV